MWGGIYGWTKYVLSLGTQTQRNRADIEDMRVQLKKLSEEVRRLLWKEEQREREDALQRENLLLKLRLQLQELERRLPPFPSGTPPSPRLENE